MPPSALFLLAVVLLAAILLIATRIRADLVALLTLVALALSGIVSPTDAFAGFSSSAVITILAIFVISEGLRQTGVTRAMGRQLLQLSGGQGGPRAVLVITLAAALLSLFMNNIAAAGVLLPAVISLSRQGRVYPSKLLMPLAFGTILGGMATLLTTSNIIVSGTLRQQGIEPFTLFDFLPVGIPVVAAGAAYLVLFGHRLLPERYPAGQAARAVRLRAELQDLYGIEKSLCRIEVLSGSAMAGLTLQEGGWGQKLGLSVLSLVRAHHLTVAPGREEVVREGDVIVAQGTPNLGLLRDYGLRVVSDVSVPARVADAANPLGEVVLSPHSRVAGKSLRQLHFREKYGLNVVALWRRGQPVLEGIPDVPLQAGDALLLQGPMARMHYVSEERDFVLLEEDPDAVARPRKAVLAATISLAALTAAATGRIPVAVAALAGGALLLLTGCLSMDDGYRAIEWKAIFLIAGMWPLGAAITSTGLADVVANGLVRAAPGLGLLGITALLMVVATILNQVIAGQAAVPILLAPIGMSLAHALGADPRSIAMAVALGSSLGFLTPVGHPVNTLVMGPGGYSYRDYLRVGGPLTLLVLAVCLIGLHFVWHL
jgi:di/tricarboxylate transporter